jgi:hypothetical protein
VVVVVAVDWRWPLRWSVCGVAVAVAVMRAVAREI